MRAVRARSGAAIVLLALAGALLLTLTGTRLAASQEAVLTAERANDVPANEPWAAFWDDVPKVDVPLSAQASTPPMGGRGSTMSARAVHDGTNLYLLLEWSDSTQDHSVGRTEDFTDAAAVEFPAPAAAHVPAFCMGDPAATVNIWQWRAAWQEDMTKGFQGAVRARYPNAAVDEYPFRGDPVFYPGRDVHNPMSVVHRTSAVDNLVAGGFGSLTADPLASVSGWGEWRDGTWRVVLTRPLQVGREGNVELYKDTWTDVAFAVWDGAAAERDGMKSVSNFLGMDIRPGPLTSGGGWADAVLIAVLAIFVLFAVMLVMDLPKARR